MSFVLRFWGRPERSKGWAHMQSVRAGAVQTNFSIFTLFLKKSFQKTSFWIHFGGNFNQKSQFWVKNGFQKMAQKGSAPPYANTGLWPSPEAPWQPPSRAWFSEQETTVWARNNNRCSFLSPFLNSFPGIGNFWVHFLKNVHFSVKSETKKTSHCRSCCLLSLSKGQWSDTLWAKARRISA